MLVVEVDVHWENVSKRINILRSKIQFLNIVEGGTYGYH